MSREIKLSVLAGRASKVIDLKKPSNLIPFKGNFPLLEPYQVQEYFKAIKTTDSLGDLPEDFQRATERGNRIVVLEDGFKSYLAKLGISPSDFQKLSNSEKSNKLIAWMSRDCIDFSQLTIK